MAEIQVLGAFGTKGKSNETTCFAINDTHIIDAGNMIRGLGDKNADVDTVWLTHSHLDHISDIAFVLDAYFEKRRKPLRIAGLAQTLLIVKKHFLNELIWPDFSKIMLLDGVTPSVEYFPIEIGVSYLIGDEEYIEAFKTNHTVPSCGYIITKQANSIAITADTYISYPIWSIINKRASIKALIIECSFESELETLAKESKHLTPKLLDMELNKLKRKVDLYVNHLKPNSEEKIHKQLKEGIYTQEAVVVHDYDIITF